MSSQLSHEEVIKSQHQAKISIIIPALTSPANLGSIFRLCDAFHVKQIFMHETVEPLLHSNRFKRTARHTQLQVEHTLFTDIRTILKSISNSPSQLFGLELTEKSKPIETVKFNSDVAIYLCLGHERTGITEQLLSHIKEHVHIRMYGQNSSLNVAQSLGIALYEITKQSYA